MTRAVIVGAGISGLSCALFAARRGHQLTVVDKDGPPPATDVYSGWDRPGVAHARQGHAFLALGSRVMQQEAPDVFAEIVASGAPEIALESNPDDTTVLCRRLVYEAILRRAVERTAGVHVLSGQKVDSLLIRKHPAGPDHVTGIRTQDGLEIEADVVVDASGRSRRARQWLPGAGLREPWTDSQDCGFTYFSQPFRARNGTAFPELRAPIVEELDFATALVFPGDNGYFHVSVAVSRTDALRTQLQDAQAFQAFLEAIEVYRPWLEIGDALHPPLAMGRIENRIHRLVDERGPIALGYCLLGDASVQTNPTFGRGVSLALWHAQAVAEELATFEDDVVAGTLACDAWVGEHLKPWYDLQVSTDEARSGQLAGRPAGDHPGGQLLAAITAMSTEDEQVRAASEQVYHMLASPADLWGDRTLMRKVFRRMRSEATAPERSGGPRREEIEQMLASTSREGML